MSASGAPRADAASLRVSEGIVLLALGLAARLPLVIAYPAIHGDDSVVRLARSDELLVGYWLPLPQLVVYAARALAPDPFWTRLAFSLLGALSAPALAALVAATAGAPAARAAGAFAALHPFLVYYSTVPYQEVVALPLLLLAALALLRGHDLWAGLALGAACFSRYECWIAAGLAALGRRRRPLRAAVLFGWAPLLWVLAWRGLSPPSSYVMDLDSGAPRLWRLPFLFGKLGEYGGQPFLALAALGVLAAWRRRLGAWAWGGAFVLLYLVGQVAFGLEFPPGSGLVGERMAHVPALAACALAGLALGEAQQFLARRSRPALAAAAACVLLAWLGTAWQQRTRALLAAANADPSLRLAFDVARLAAEQLSPTGRLAVAAPPLPADAADSYLRKLERAGGDVARARAIVRALPPADVLRIRAHLARPPTAVALAGDVPAELIAVYDDAPSAGDYAGRPRIARFVHGARGVTVYRL
jgi:hypothetical protein